MEQFTIKIADVVFQIDAFFPETRQFFSRFLTDEPAGEFLQVRDRDIADFREKAPHFTDEMCERAILKYKMDKRLVDYGVFPLHASAISYRGEGYVFTALSGVGKSTHARRWQEAFGAHVTMINDDRPCIKVEGDRVYACGHPQAGKHNLYTNSKVPVKVIAKIVRSKDNDIRRLSKAEFFPFLYQQSFTLDEPSLTAKIVALHRKVLDGVYLYEIRCNMDADTAVVILEKLNADLQNR